MNKKDCSFEPIISPYALKRPVNWGEQFNRRASIDVEIGFGMGEVLMQAAQRSPERNFIGIEQRWERVYKTLCAITRKQSSDQDTLKNIRILKIDAHVVFERLVAQKTIDFIYCLFPCPWPKKGHIKHRLFSNGFLRLLNSRLKKGGQIKIVTDFYPYREWILEQAGRTGFQIETKTVSAQYNTKFEKKWKEEGQEKFFELGFLKKRHINVPHKKDTPLKSYTLDHFDIDRLRLRDEKGDITVIFKELVFDKQKQKAMIHALVAEEHLTQHFWVSVIRKQKKWRILKAEGQNFFPTPGIARALALVYEAALDT